jgi:hypothetical protein
MMTRRDAAWLVARAAAAAGGQEFFGEWLSAAQGGAERAAQHGAHHSAPPEPERWTGYQPKFFSPADFQTLEIFTEILIPTDETPGAREAHVAPFIDFVVFSAAEYAPETQPGWRNAMNFLRGQKFAQLSPAQQVALVESMAAPEHDGSKKHEGFAVYRLIKGMTIHAYYTSRTGLVDNLEYKGNTYLTEFPACTHPEHRKV